MKILLKGVSIALAFLSLTAFGQKSTSDELDDISRQVDRVLDELRADLRESAKQPEAIEKSSLAARAEVLNADLEKSRDRVKAMVRILAVRQKEIGQSPSLSPDDRQQLGQTLKNQLEECAQSDGEMSALSAKIGALPAMEKEWREVYSSYLSVMGREEAAAKVSSAIEKFSDSLARLSTLERESNLTVHEGDNRSQQQRTDTELSEVPSSAGNSGAWTRWPPGREDYEPSLEIPPGFNSIPPLLQNSERTSLNGRFRSADGSAEFAVCAIYPRDLPPAVEARVIPFPTFPGERIVQREPEWKKVSAHGNNYNRYAESVTIEGQRGAYTRYLRAEVSTGSLPNAFSLLWEFKVANEKSRRAYQSTYREFKERINLGED